MRDMTERDSAAALFEYNLLTLVISYQESSDGNTCYRSCQKIVSVKAAKKMEKKKTPRQKLSGIYCTHNMPMCE